MKKSIFNALFIALAVFAIASCSKYEEGSKFTVLTKKMRVVNTWKVDKITYTSGGFSTTVSGDITLDIKKDNTYSAVYTSGSSSYTETGVWAFSGDKTQFVMTDSDGNIESATIIKLKNNEFSLEDVDGNTTTRVDYITK